MGIRATDADTNIDAKEKDFLHGQGSLGFLSTQATARDTPHQGMA